MKKRTHREGGVGEFDGGDEGGVCSLGQSCPPPPHSQCSPVHADVRKWCLTPCKKYNFVTVVLL